MLNKEKFKEKLGRMIPNPLRLALKMFGLVWFFLVLQVVLKLTFNYWQPYVIPTEQLENVGNFIDNHRWLQATLNGVFYIINGILVLLCCLQQWWFKNKKEVIISLSVFLVCYILNETLNLRDYTPFITTIALPLFINKKKWLWVILTFIASNLFMILSFALEGLTNANNLNYIIRMFLQNDYFIMLILNYILFNIIRMKQEMKHYGK